MSRRLARTSPDPHRDQRSVSSPLNVLDHEALRSAGERRLAAFDTVAQGCAEKLGAIIAEPPRADGDWSIEWTGCRCDVCDTLEAFLGSRSRRIFEWPLAKEGRRHVHSQVDSAELPVRHETRRQGRPYTLV